MEGMKEMEGTRKKIKHLSLYIILSTLIIIVALIFLVESMT